MEKISKSGLYFPNKIARLALITIEEVIGTNGLKTILNVAHLPEFIEALPPDNLERAYDFADFSAIFGSLEEVYGVRGGRVLALRAGRSTFESGLRNFGALAGVGDQAFKILPRAVKIRLALPALAKVFSSTSDQLTTVQDMGDHYCYTIHKCPVCWGRQTDKPACNVANGLVQEALKWFSGGNEFRVTQSTARSCGDENCSFLVNKEPLS